MQPLGYTRCLGHRDNQESHFTVYLTSCSALSSDYLPVLIDTTCRSSFRYPPDRPDFRRTDWAKFQTHLEDQIPLDPELHGGMAIGTCVENFSGAFLKALAASTPKRRPRADLRPPITDGIQDTIRLKNRLWRQRQVTRNPTLTAEVNRLQRSVTRRLNEWRNDQWSATLESRRPVAVEDGQAGDESSYSVSPLVTRATAEM